MANNLHGNIISLIQAKKYAQAETAARAKLRLMPADGFLWRALGVAQKMQGKDSLAAFERSAKLLPQDAESHNNFAVALKLADRHEDALNSYREAITINPQLPDSHANIAKLLRLLNRDAEALPHAIKAAQLRPIEENFNELGMLQQALGQADEAEQSYRLAVQDAPNAPYAYLNLSALFRNSGQYLESILMAERAIRLKPDMAAAYFNLGNAQCDIVEIDAALASYRKAIDIDPTFYRAHHNLLFSSHYSTGFEKRYLQDAKHYGEVISANRHQWPNWHSKRIPENLRIGFVSGDLRTHPVAFFLLNVLQELRACGKLELFAYSSHRVQDRITEQLRNQFHHWRDITFLSDETASNAIHDDAIDVLIDLAGHTTDNRLGVFAYKPAPIQLTWLGYFGSTGLSQMDYFLADSHVAPPQIEAQFAEKLLRLPSTVTCFTAPDFQIEIGPLPSIRQGSITFGCFNNLSKINAEVIALWSRIIRDTPGSRLFLNTKQLKDNTIRQRIAAAFARHGVTADRLLLEFLPTRESSIESYNRLDIALDPFPYAGGTTTAEALWMGVPVLTLAGNTYAGRLGVSCLANVGLPDWIADSTDIYLEKAIAFANDPATLSFLRTNLRAQALASPLFDAKKFAADFAETMNSICRVKS